MRAVGFQSPTRPEAAVVLTDIEVPKPVPLGRDPLVELKANSVNRINAKIPKSFRPAPANGECSAGMRPAWSLVPARMRRRFKQGDEVNRARASAGS